MSLLRICSKLALAGGLVCACSLNQSSSDEAEVVDPVTADAAAAVPVPSSSTPSKSPPPASAPASSADASTDATTTDGAASDAGSKDGGPKVTDAAVDAAPDSGGTLPYGAPCQPLANRCASKLCVPFEDGPHCTKACTKDTDCPNGNDCADKVKVCEVE